MGFGMGQVLDAVLPPMIRTHGPDFVAQRLHTCSAALVEKLLLVPEIFGSAKLRWDDLCRHHGSTLVALYCSQLEKELATPASDDALHLRRPSGERSEPTSLGEKSEVNRLALVHSTWKKMMTMSNLQLVDCQSQDALPRLWDAFVRIVVPAWYRVREVTTVTQFWQLSNWQELRSEPAINIALGIDLARLFHHGSSSSSNRSGRLSLCRRMDGQLKDFFLQKTAGSERDIEFLFFNVDIASAGLWHVD